MRSLLFVPGDRPDRMEKALTVGADAIILDLEDAVAPARKPKARLMVSERLAVTRDHRVRLIVRINALDSALAQEDLEAILPHCPDAIMLPKVEGAASIEALLALHPEMPPILPLAVETAGSLFELGSLRRCASSLAGITWGAEDLAASLSARTNRDQQGSFLAPYQLARSLTLLAAAAAAVPAIDTVYPDFRDLDGLAAYAQAAARDGFGGMLAIHPSQIAVINDAFTPTTEEIARARAIVEAFKAQPEAGVLQLDGKMIDAPHINQAERLLARSYR